MTPKSKVAIQGDSARAEINPIAPPMHTSFMTLLQKECLNFPRFGAYREPDTDLSAAQCHRIGKNAIDSDDRKRHGHCRRDPKQNEQKRPARHRVPVEVPQSSNLRQWHARVHTVDLRCDFFEQAFRARAAASYRERDTPARTWKVDQPGSRVIHAVLVDILDNPHNRAPRPIRTDSKSLPDRSSRRAPVFTSHVFRHDGHPPIAEQIIPGEVPARHQPRPKRGK